jgi:hypothetical protein
LICFLQTGPISSFHHFPMISSKYESTSGLIHSLGQSPQDPITSQGLDLPAGDKASDTPAFWGVHN